MTKSTMVGRFSFTHFIITGLTAAMLIIANAGAALAMDYYKTAGNFAVYLGVLPAQLVQGHSPEHPDGKMHGGVPSTRSQYHVVVAIFDTKDGRRIGESAVTARVTEPGNDSVEKKLEPIVIANTISFGNYFSMSSPGRYRIDITIRRPGAATATAAFEYSR